MPMREKTTAPSDQTSVALLVLSGLDLCQGRQRELRLQAFPERFIGMHRETVPHTGDSLCSQLVEYSVKVGSGEC